MGTNGDQRGAVSDKDKRMGRVGFVVFLAIGLGLWILGQWSREQFRMSPISGRVDSIKFSDKGKPIIFLGGKDFYLDAYDPRIGTNISVGDSVYKSSGTFDLYVSKMRNDTAWFRYYWTVPK